MSASAPARAHQREREQLAAAVAAAVGREWERVDPEDLQRSWARLLARVLGLIAAGQLTSAQQAEPYLRELLRGTDAEGAIVPEALAGVASDGRELPGLLMYPVWVALHAITRGLSLVSGMAAGRAFLDLLARSLVADAGRAADLVGMIARPAVTSYIRVVQAGACSRCIILAGAEYGISTGFLRHPRCQCTMEPVTRDHRPEPVDARDVYARMSDAQRRKAFGQAGVRAIEDGADIAQVVNARRGMKTATAYGRKVQATTEGITRRGVAGTRLRNFERRPGQRYRTSRTPRLMPEEIYRLASDREHAIRLLRRHGYLD